MFFLGVFFLFGGGSHVVMVLFYLVSMMFQG